MINAEGMALKLSVHGEPGAQITAPVPWVGEVCRPSRMATERCCQGIEQARCHRVGRRWAGLIRCMKSRPAARGAGIEPLRSGTLFASGTSVVGSSLLCTRSIRRIPSCIAIFGPTFSWLAVAAGYGTMTKAVCEGGRSADDSFLDDARRPYLCEQWLTAEQPTTAARDTLLRRTRRKEMSPCPDKRTP